MTHAEPLAPPPERDPSPDWGQSLSNGAAGIALLHIAYAHTGIGGSDTAHQWVTAMTRSPVVADPDACGLFRGAPAVAFVLRIAARPQYAAALRTLDGISPHSPGSAWTGHTSGSSAGRYRSCGNTT